MGAALSSTHGVYPIGSAGGTAGSEAVNKYEDQKPPPQIIYFYPRQREQQVKDTYDSSLQESRFQFQSPEHF